MAKNVIHAGGIFPNPTLNREGAAAVNTLPGTIGVFNAGKFTVSTDGKEASIQYVVNIDYLRCKSVDEVIETGEVVIGIHPISGMFFNVRAVAGNYKKGEALIIGNGQVKAGGDDTSQFFAEETADIVAGDLLRVVFK